MWCCPRPASPRPTARTPTWSAACSAGRRASGRWARAAPIGQILAALAERWLAAQVAPQTSAVSETAQVSGAKTADWKKKKQKAKVGPVSKPWNYPTIGTVLDEIGKAVPAYAGIRWETLGEGGLQWNASALARPARRVEPVESRRSRPRPRAATCW